MCGFVGFTNCIDDSNKALENMMNRIIPVSYTHLTLPTKLEV